METFERNPDIEKLKEKGDIEGLIKALENPDVNIRDGAMESIIGIDSGLVKYESDYD